MEIHAGLLGKYELRELLGQGGMAEVWKAFDALLQRYVAIKFLHTTLRNDPSFVARFVREAQAVASLRHPNIVHIYDFEISSTDEVNSLAYMVMDYIEGPTLAAYLRSTARAGKFLDAPALVSLFLSIGEAIDYAHRRGLLHRDIKPANILLDQSHTTRNMMGEPTLTDFGIVKMLGTEAGTFTGTSVGTPHYISPEQARGRPVSAASDLYSLGAILYETCAGRPPFQSELPLAILQQHVTMPPPPPEQFNPAISPALSAVILRSLAKDPEQRYPSALALVTALAEALQVVLPERRGQPLSAPDIRTLPISSVEVQDVPTQTLGRPSPVPVVVVNPATPFPDVFSGEEDTPPGGVGQLAHAPERALSPVQDRLPALVAPPRPARLESRSRQLLIALTAVLLVALAGTGLSVFLAIHASHLPNTGAATSPLAGRAFFTSSGDASGMHNLGLNDTFQVTLTHIPAPQAGKQYYAWLLPDLDQTEASPRALGTLVLNDGVASLRTAYIDPQHANLIGLFSRFLVTEEPVNPVPVSPSLDTATWRYYAAIPQSSPLNNCQGSINQLGVLCHLRHLLSGDPELAQVHLAGGLDFWFLNNIKELVKWTQEAVDHSAAADIRHKLVNILYILDGNSCIQQDVQQHGAPGLDNTPDDGTLPTIAAIPLLNCALTPNAPGYIVHIHNHLNALLQSPGVLSSQKVLATQIGAELNAINSWLQDVQNDARQLLALDDTQLMQANGENMRGVLNMQATSVLSGGVNPTNGALIPGAESISEQIQQLATMDVMTYQAK